MENFNFLLEKIANVRIRPQSPVLIHHEHTTVTEQLIESAIQLSEMLLEKGRTMIETQKGVRKGHDGLSSLTKE